jgi:DNA-directed RNA polymerase specialized sigma24 family protein
VILMRKVEGLSQKEAAHRMGVTVDTVENQVAKGMRLLTQAMCARRGTVTTEARRYNFFRKSRDVH